MTLPPASTTWSSRGPSGGCAVSSSTNAASTERDQRARAEREREDDPPGA